MPYRFLKSVLGNWGPLKDMRQLPCVWPPGQGVINGLEFLPETWWFSIVAAAFINIVSKVVAMLFVKPEVNELTILPELGETSVAIVFAHTVLKDVATLFETLVGVEVTKF